MSKLKRPQKPFQHLWELTGPAKIYLVEGQTISDGSRYIVFHHLDGMYSYCKTEKGNITHLSAATPLVAFKDGFQFYNDLMPNE